MKRREKKGQEKGKSVGLKRGSFKLKKREDLGAQYLVTPQLFHILFVWQFQRLVVLVRQATESYHTLGYCVFVCVHIYLHMYKGTGRWTQTHTL